MKLLAYLSNFFLKSKQPSLEEPKNSIFYKYRSLSGGSRKFTEDILINSEMYFATPDQFNDPFEFAANINLNGNREEITEYFKQSKFDQMDMLKEFSEEKFYDYVGTILESKNALGWHDAIKKLKSKYGVLCLSNSHSNINMWSHYGDNHKGVCFEFESAEADDIFSHARKVTYDLEPPRIEIIQEYIDAQKRKEMTRKIVYHKFSTAWDKESEWRILCNQSGVHGYSPKSLKTIYLGCEFDLKDSFINLIQKHRPDVDVVLLKKSKSEYRMEELWRGKPSTIFPHT